MRIGQAICHIERWSGQQHRLAIKAAVRRGLQHWSMVGAAPPSYIRFHTGKYAQKSRTEYTCNPSLFKGLPLTERPA